jgi:hypothetical protein
MAAKLVQRIRKSDEEMPFSDNIVPPANYSAQLG